MEHSWNCVVRGGELQANLRGEKIGFASFKIFKDTQRVLEQRLGFAPGMALPGMAGGGAQGGGGLTPFAGSLVMTGDFAGDGIFASEEQLLETLRDASVAARSLRC